jgi:hypothetical protein
MAYGRLEIHTHAYTVNYGDIEGTSEICYLSHVHAIATTCAHDSYYVRR